MSALSPSGVFSAQTASELLSAGRLSPVRALSSAFRFTQPVSLRSAGTKSPSLTVTISPGTSSEAFIFFSCPPRITDACGADMFLSISMAFSALLSCTTPITASTVTMASMMTESVISPSPPRQDVMNETAAAISRIITMKSENCEIKRANMLLRLAFFISFLPYSRRRCSACRSVRPFPMSVLRRAAHSLVLRLCHSKRFSSL